MDATRLAIVHDWLTGMRGGEKCLEPLCRRHPDASLHTLIHAPGKVSPAIEGLQRRAIEAVLARLPDWDRATADRVSHFVAISRTVRDRIHDCYGRDSSFFYHPADTDIYTPAAVPRADYYLCVSALAPYKRI